MGVNSDYILTGLFKSPSADLGLCLDFFCLLLWYICCLSNIDLGLAFDLAPAFRIGISVSWLLLWLILTVDFLREPAGFIGQEVYRKTSHQLGLCNVYHSFCGKL